MFTLCKFVKWVFGWITKSGFNEGEFLVWSSVYINSSMFHKYQQTSLKAASNSTEESVVHPLPNLFRLLGLTPFKKVMVCLKFILFWLWLPSWWNSHELSKKLQLVLIHFSVIKGTPQASLRRILRKAQPFGPYHCTGTINGWGVCLGVEALVSWKIWDEEDNQDCQYLIK